MGTRSLTYVYDGADDYPSKPIICMYRQFDGYPTGHGAELNEFLAGGKVVNGLSGDTSKLFNGAGCLAAALVAHFKDGAGGFYLHVPTPNTDAGQDYEYHVVVHAPGENVTVRVVEYYGDKLDTEFMPVEFGDPDATTFAKWIVADSEKDG